MEVIGVMLKLIKNKLDIRDLAGEYTPQRSEWERKSYKITNETA